MRVDDAPFLEISRRFPYGPDPVPYLLYKVDSPGSVERVEN